MKAGHVLSDNAKVNWGHHDDEEGDSTQFLEDSRQPTDTDSDTATSLVKAPPSPEKHVLLGTSLNCASVVRNQHQ
jgi:hypothetical protein